MISFDTLLALSEDGELTGVSFEEMEAWAMEHGLDPEDDDVMDEFLDRAFEAKGWVK